MLQEPKVYAATLMYCSNYNMADAIKMAVEAQAKFPGMSDGYLVDVIIAITEAGR